MNHCLCRDVPSPDGTASIHIVDFYCPEHGQSKSYHPEETTMTDHDNIVGAWYYDAVGAKFPPHVIVFRHGGTLVSSNPDRGEPTNSASSGIGIWRLMRPAPDRHPVTFVGRFVEVNADPTTNAHTGNLTVDFTVVVHGDTFDGDATATYTNPDGTPQAGPFPAKLKGQRITLTSAPPVAEQ